MPWRNGVCEKEGTGSIFLMRGVQHRSLHKRWEMFLRKTMSNDRLMPTQTWERQKMDTEINEKKKDDAFL